MNFVDTVRELRRNVSVSVPFTGKVLADLTPNASYLAAKRGELGVPTFKVGKRVRVASMLVLEKLGIAPEFSVEEQAEADQPPAGTVMPPSLPEKEHRTVSVPARIKAPARRAVRPSPPKPSPASSGRRDTLQK
jgi:hypothetical protein